MKTALILCFLIGGCISSNNLRDLIKKEVHAIVSNDRDLTVEHFTTKCDALFDLVDHQDEHYTDNLCKAACNCGIEGTGKHCTPTTTAPHSTHHPHHTKQHNTKPMTAATTTTTPPTTSTAF